MHPALFYSREDDGALRCGLCAHNCLILPGQRGICGARENIDGRLYALSYGNIVAANIDPIEKKPLYHFLPRTLSYSVATPGCNFRCRFCQNWQIAQMQATRPPGHRATRKRYLPENIVRAARESGCRSISYTYTEPTIFFEYALDIARLARRQGLANVFVTNGYINEGPLKEIADYLDAANVDLKSFREEVYSRVCGGRLAPVLDTITRMHSLGIWVEITTLVVPGLNDDMQQLGQIARFIAGIDKGIPWHILRFHPDYKMMDAPCTPIQTLNRARSLAYSLGLKYVYLGNV